MVWNPIGFELNTEWIMPACSVRIERASSLSAGVQSGEGDGSVTRATKQGALCGRGEMSIASMPGEDEGIGGVVAPSYSTGGVTSKSLSWENRRLRENRDLLGVGT